VLVAELVGRQQQVDQVLCVGAVSRVGDVEVPVDRAVLGVQ
jgi:hypothetical protein